jgi:hypothetical protein
MYRMRNRSSGPGRVQFQIPEGPESDALPVLNTAKRLLEKAMISARSWMLPNRRTLRHEAGGKQFD